MTALSGTHDAMLDERGINIKEAPCWFHMSCEKRGEVVEVPT